MQEGQIEYSKYDTVQISKQISKFVKYSDSIIRIRGFLDCSLWVADGSNHRTKNISLITSNKGKLRTTPIYGVCNVFSCRMVLFEKYIMDRNKIKRPAFKIGDREVRVQRIRF